MDIPARGKITVCGDIHAQLIDLLTIFDMNGYPSSEHPYVFNGDFVDRGPSGCEVVFILYAFKVWNPKCIFLNRGNHEARKINEKYNFEEECANKYDAALFELFQGNVHLLTSRNLLRAPTSNSDSREGPRSPWRIVQGNKQFSVLGCPVRCSS